MSVTTVSGISTRVYARYSMLGWYIAARDWRSTIGLCAKSAGISAWEVRAAKRTALNRTYELYSYMVHRTNTHKKMTPPREKNDEVEFGEL